ncbi:complement C2 [Alosa sapidissima]|uniref:complement C2 n=1 Tax=Alosa sapidissima TaxID=34773 RepID=UPI001C0A5CD5|nr:complement C2 [Alosa sapidissima]
MSLFSVLLLCFTLLHTTFTQDYYDYGPTECKTSESITGGTVEYSDGGNEFSVLTYKCSSGFVPYPVTTRSCTDGEWSIMTSISGTPVDRAECKKLEQDSEESSMEEERNCSLSETISKGQVSYSKGGMKGSVLTYTCPDSYAPYPVSQRMCGPDGKWTPMRQPSGRPVSRATCKEMLCPAQMQLDNGDITPRQQWFKIGENQTFSCNGGYNLRGSAVRTCTPWGGWTGETPICDDQADDCANPGVPPGAQRSGSRFRIGDKVQFRCDLKLDLLGSAERVCLESREWSGAPARCQAWYGFDSPNTVAQAMGGSLSSIMDYSSPEFKKKAKSYGRILQVNKGRLNVFILMDNSGSIRQEYFQEARRAVASLIRKLDSYEVTLRFHIVSFATTARVIVNINSFDSDQASQVLSKLEKFKYESHGNKKGTNIQSALKSVYDELSLLKTRNVGFNETANVILITTDGQSNTGGSTKAVLLQIRDLFGYTSLTDHTNENLLDVYVFGVGQDVNKKELNDLASKKRGEEHVFLLQDYKQLGKVFNKMISDRAVTMCGVAREEEEGKKNSAETRPWHVHVKWDGKVCQGSLLSPLWVLTAAHCLTKPTLSGGNTIADAKDVEVTTGTNEILKSANFTIHPQYNVRGLQTKNVKEFYDYDIALIKMEKNISASYQTRPICLPCTVPASRALKMVNSTCAQHKKALLDLSETQAHFMSKKHDGMKRMQTHIQLGDERRPECLEVVKGTFSKDTNASVTDVVTDRFMCTGGSKAHTDDLSCQGDSGGALFLRKRMRYFQVGVLSWGTIDVCKNNVGKNPLNARDFHISLFSLMPWLRKHLHQDLAFLPPGN